MTNPFTICDHCDKASKRTLLTYWGAVYCPRCVQVTAEYLDRADIWPVPPWEFNV